MLIYLVRPSYPTGADLKLDENTYSSGVSKLPRYVPLSHRFKANH